MTTAPQPRGPRPGPRRALRLVHTLRTQLTRQFITRNRRMAFALSVLTLAIAVASVHVSAWWFSPGVMILPILAGGLLLWPRALRIFFGFAAVALIYDVAEGKAGAGIIATIVLTAAFADVLARTREKLGVQGPAALRRVRRPARLVAPGRVPPRLQRLHEPRQNQRGLRHRRAPVARPGHGGVRGGLSRAPAGRALRRSVRPLAAHPRPRD